MRWLCSGFVRLGDPSPLVPFAPAPAPVVQSLASMVCSGKHVAGLAFPDQNVSQSRSASVLSHPGYESPMVHARYDYSVMSVGRSASSALAWSELVGHKDATTRSFVD